MKRDFTASVYLIQKQSSLLIFHPKFKKWLPPGGHVEPNESPADAARREVLEETGMEIEWIRDERVWVQTENAQSFERPFACLAERVPESETEPAHEHLDFIYVARPVSSNPDYTPEHEMKWVKLADLESRENKLDLFPDTLDFLTILLRKPNPIPLSPLLSDV